MATARGMPPPSVSRVRFVPHLARSVGLGPVFPPAQRRFGHRAVESLPLPLDACERLVGKQATVPEVAEHACLGPLLETAVRTTLRADPRGAQRFPLAAGAQHEENGVHGPTVGHARAMATERVGLTRGDQRFHLGPECVGEAPAIISGHESHASASFQGGSTPGKYPNPLLLTPYRDRLLDASRRDRLSFKHG